MREAIARLSSTQMHREMEATGKALDVLRSYRWPSSLAEFASKIGTSPKMAVRLLKKISASGSAEERRLAKALLRHFAESSHGTLSGARDEIVRELDRVYSETSAKFKELSNRKLAEEYERLKQAVKSAKSEQERRALIMQRNAAKNILEWRGVKVD